MNSYFGKGSMVGGGMYGKDVYNPNSPDYEGDKPVDTDKDGINDNAPQQSYAGQEFDRIQQGYDNLRAYMGDQNSGNSFSDNFFQPVDKDNDRINDLQTGLYADQVGKNFDMARSEQQADFQSGLYKDNALFGANLEMRNNRELTADQFAYDQRNKENTFQLTDEYQNREYGRNIGTMAAAGEQTRKNYAEQGVQNRLGTITTGEQFRLGVDAQGDQTRKNYRVEGDETRQTDSNRINTQGKNDQRGYRVLGDETRKTDTNRISTQESSDKKIYEFEDNINARGEARSAARAKGLARGF
jgi:hypothetical protein